MADVEMDMGSCVRAPIDTDVLSRKRSFEEIDCVEEEEAGSKTQQQQSQREATPITSTTNGLGNSIRNAHVRSETPVTGLPTFLEQPLQQQSLPVSDLPAPSSAAVDTDATLTSTILTPIPPPNPVMQTTPSTPKFTTPNPTIATTTSSKKRKISPASKEAKAQEKEAKERTKAEEKAKREEERKKKEDEKKKRDEEREEERKKREEKRKIKEEERLAREEEKRKKEEERKKKERSQMRLNAFFAKPATSSSTNNTSSATARNATPDCDGKDGSNSPSGENASPAKKSLLSDYEREFPPFFLQSHVTLAPQHRFERDSDSLKHMREKIDAAFKTEPTETSSPPERRFRPSELFRIMPYKRRQGKPTAQSLRELIVSIQEASSEPINLTDDATSGPKQKPEDLLKKIPMKVLKFAEDVRPPYQGTFTQPLPEHTARKLCRNPFSRTIPDFNYDYDSEAEWDEPEEGEELDSEGEEEMSEDGDEDMEGFLDDGDEDDPTNTSKRRIIVGDLEPSCSGIRWEGDGDVEVDLGFEACRMQVISETLNFPIDPFSTSYWIKPSTTATQPPSNLLRKQSSQFLAPHQAASGAIPSSSSLNAQQQQPSLPPGQTTLPGAAAPKPRRIFPPEQVAEFKDVVAGSNLTKAGLIEVLKKRFPKISKDVIKDTLTLTAVRHGQKEADKKWVLI
ncbi:hypothetical protein AJ80_01138 [Polytolypa hystricis UAMH7299]|uniref:Chromatin assembly factor 1 subunit A n=1 Tax=Polytolypa hystricis (strain UAMH7299) TaxID=1447883 RepID=A0A2B7Z1H8_POLH7|nr:hypothetical protein AJ80_01138 [Polytolypa hystricis UAMH7299]